MSVGKSFGAFSRPTARISGLARSAGLERGALATSTAFGITTVRSDAHVPAASPASRSRSETQIVTVVSGSTSRSAHR